MMETPPADKFFGSTHVSVPGIRNSINDTNVRAVGAGEERGHGLLHMLLFTEQAFHDWQHRYPNDSWIVTNGYEMVDDFAKLDAETPNENPMSQQFTALIWETGWMRHTQAINMRRSNVSGSAAVLGIAATPIRSALLARGAATSSSKPQQGSRRRNDRRCVQYDTRTNALGALRTATAH